MKDTWRVNFELQLTDWVERAHPTPEREREVKRAIREWALRCATKGVPDEAIASPVDPTQFVCDVPAAQAVVTFREFRSTFDREHLISVRRIATY